MPLDTEQKVEERRQWLPLSGPYAGVELLLRQATPSGAEKFRQRLCRLGIMRQGKDGTEINTGRDDDFFRAFTEHYVLDWRGDIRPTGTAFDAALMTEHVKGSLALFEMISKAVGDDAAFFAPSNGGSTGK